MTTLIIARHGNTFAPDDTITYVGARTDLPLVQKGYQQARAIGIYIRENNLVPDVIYTSTLKRTIETAQTALGDINIPMEPVDIFNEIDYGPDENKTKEEIIVRIGEQALKDWETRNIVPDGWQINPDQIIRNWQTFADNIVQKYPDGIVMVITSNGIVRFAPHITGETVDNPKIATGALCLLKYRDKQWHIDKWNLKP